MRLSAIIPNYNGAETIEKCIASLCDQSVEIDEIIVVDDASVDDSIRRVEARFPAVRTIEHDRNYGAARSRNDGIRASNGEWLVFVDSDVYLLHDCLERLLEDVDRRDIVYPSVRYEDGTILSPASENERSYIRRSPVFLIRRSALSRLDDLFDEDYYIYFEDIDFFMRCYLAGLRSKYIEHASAEHAIVKGSRNLERRFYLETKNTILCIAKFFWVPKAAKRQLQIPHVGKVLSKVQTAILNRNTYTMFPDHRGARLTTSRRRSLYILFEAVLWNIKNAKKTAAKQARISRRWRA